MIKTIELGLRKSTRKIAPNLTPKPRLRKNRKIAEIERNFEILTPRKNYLSKKIQKKPPKKTAASSPPNPPPPTNQPKARPRLKETGKFTADRKHEDLKKEEKSKKSEEDAEIEERKFRKCTPKCIPETSAQKWHPKTTKSLVTLFENQAGNNSDDVRGDRFENLGGKRNEPMRCNFTLGRELGLDVTKSGKRMHHSDWVSKEKFGQSSE